MKKAARSFGFAISGLMHAVKEERNIRLFLIGYAVIFFVSWQQNVILPVYFVYFVLIGLFLITELINTAFERVVDVIDDCEKKKHNGHFHIGLKQAKDVAAAASLIALLINIAFIGGMFLPFIRLP